MLGKEKEKNNDPMRQELKLEKDLRRDILDRLKAVIFKPQKERPWGRSLQIVHNPK
jgi:hypothetical protein